MFALAVQKLGIAQYGWTHNVTMSGRKIFFFVVDFFVLSVLLLTNGILSHNVLEKCREECQSRMTQDISAEDECNGPCEVQQCFYGCSLWTEGTSSSCQNVCNAATNTQKHSILCTYGCSIGTSVYVQNLKDELGRPAAPHLVNKTHNSVTIQWEKSPYSNISFLVQWKYETGSSNWEYYDPDHLLKTNKVQIKGLHPYTKYKFRVAWILLPRSNVYLSEESVSISTHAHGAPSSSPIISSLAAVGSTKISVSWEPPYFINGPIVAYDLELIDNGTGSRTIKEHFQPNDGLHYMFADLTPKTKYILSIKARNSQGMGPSADREITTGFVKNIDREYGDPPPQMVLATKNHVYIRDLYKLFKEPSMLYQTENSSVEIKGFALHAKNEIFWLADSIGRIHSVNFQGGKSRRDIILSDMDKTNSPTLLSVDWLNDKLYILEENQISRCSFRGENYEVVVTGITEIPSDIQVDPFNGYLYWVSQGVQQGGLYRVDLEKVKTTFVSSREAELVKKDSNLYSLAIDYENMRLILPVANEHTFKSYNLDGSDGTDIRKNSVTPDVSKIRSVAFYKPRGTLCWTNGSNAYGEDYKADDSKFFHNDFMFDIDNKPCNTIRVSHKSTQPDPIPFNPVEEVQAIFKEDMGKIHWKKPRLLGGLGQGAYQDWSYEVNLIDMTENRSLTIQRNGISSTQYTMDNLLPNKTYVVRVRAYSVGGKGPWSTNFTGKTVRNSTNSPNGYPYIIWSARKGILKSDLLGEEVEQLIDRERFNQGHITDMTWYRDTIFLNTNNSDIFIYNISWSNGSPKRLDNITNIVSIAVDWLAPKLYRSSPIHQLISRSNLDGSHSEHLPIQTIAKELAIDSPQGRLYWATSHSVECSKLNGDNIHVYFQTGLFSGKHVMGLTLDFDANKVYWMVRSHEGAFLYSANKDCDDCHDLNESIYIIGTLPENDVKGPLWYFSDHLYWLHERKEALVSDLEGKNVATLRGLGLTGLRSLIVIDPSLQPSPHQAAGEINVVPYKIKKSQIALDGTWDDFTIHWQPVVNVNYGIVFYEVVFYQTKSESSKELDSLVTTYPSYYFNVSKPISPYSRLTLSIRPFTYWASARPTVVNLTTPEDIPSKPTNPRVYVSYKKYPLSTTKSIEVEFRWSPPEKPNGKIDGYQVYCYDETSRLNLCGERWHNEEKTSFRYNATANTNYYFKVRARTAMGDGNYSDIVVAKTSQENPVPQLLLAKIDSLYLADIDTQEERLLARVLIEPVAVTFLNEGNMERIFWLDTHGSLMSSQLSQHNPNVSVIKTSFGVGIGIAIDWIGRFLYWSERTDSYSTIWVMDLNNAREPKVIINTTDYIGALDVDPFSSTLIYNEIGKNGKGQLKAAGTDGHNLRSFFSQPLRYHPIGKRSSKRRESRGKPTCDCPLRLSVGHVITIDRSNPDKPEVLWVDDEHGHIYAADMKGCFCRIVVNAMENLYGDNGLPPSSITADKSKIYWSNDGLGQIFSVDKSSIQRESRHQYHGRNNPASQLRTVVRTKSVAGIKQIRAIGDHLQPYPRPECLSPLTYRLSPRVQTRTPNSITLVLRDAERSKDCGEISFSTVIYTVYYGKIQSNGTRECIRKFGNCKIEKSYNTTVILKNLDPYTNYTVEVAVSNYYTVGEPTPGPTEVFQTKEGAPTAPVGVTAIPISPSRIDVFWEPPIIPNGNNISYEVRWHPTNEKNEEENAHYTLEPEFSGGKHVKSITTKIEPGSEYIILVRAFSVSKDLFSDSTEVSVTTFDLPSNVTLENATSRQLNVRWKSPPNKAIYRHKLEYSEVGTQIWQTLKANITNSDEIYTFELTDLKPKASYEIQLQLTYNTSNVTYTWPSRDRPKFVFQTLGDSPDIPNKPEVKSISKDLYQVRWEEVDRNGGEDLIYELQFLPVAYTETSQSLQYKIEPEVLNYDNLSSWNGSSPQSSILFSTSIPKVPDWQTVYNGSQNQWIIKDLPSQAQYEFRVRAITEYGASNFSEVGNEFFLPEPGAYLEPVNEPTGLILIAVLSASAFVVVTLFVALCLVQRRRDNFKKVIQGNGQIIHGPDVELAQLRELPHHENFRHRNNDLYSVGDIPSDEELATIPHISREQIGLTKFLGSGAFGEVFEGTAHDLDDEESSLIKVAVKTLRKGATDQEKAEFLKEAKLMSNFQHEHILKLLGICLNNNPNFIILELMEGGDLLSYLRSNRPTAINPCSLTLDDLLGICVDVAKGCQYLEEMHFVHRDLAARNCLVSSHNPALRIVKIGDFGLARDIYKNDYYRKEGEGLLPVRWMAPESLVDGVFTSQSDIWAFGVLLWEVMTLGQQPYPARTNLDVLHHVRGGGRLDKPGNCPDDLHELMLKCWNYCPENRPSFTYCLETLEDLKHKNSAQNTPLIPHNYIGRYYDGFDNLAYHSEDLQRPQSQEELAKIRDSLADQHPLLSDLPTDSDSLNSPNGPISTRANDGRLRRGNSTTRASETSESSSFTSPLLQNGAMANHQNPTGSRAKYLELLPDNDFSTDTDGYEVPLPVLPPAVALERLRRQESNTPSTDYAQMNHFLTKNPTPTSPTSRRIKLPPTCLTAGAPSNTAVIPGKNGVLLDKPAKSPSTNDNYLIRGKKSPSNSVENGRTSISPLVTSALLKPSVSETRINNNIGDEDSNSLETTNPFYRNNSSHSVTLQCTPSVHRCGTVDNPCRLNDSLYGERKNGSDTWSLSSASTSACLDNESKRNSGISTLSTLSNGIDLSYTPKSSLC